MRTRRFIKNTLFSGLLFTISFITGLFLPKLYLNYFNSEINGLIGSLTAFISYFILIESGFRGAAIYRMYEPIASKDELNIDKIMSKTKITYNLFALVYLLFTLVFAIIVPQFLIVAGISKIQLFLLTIILGMPTFIDFLIYQKYYILFTVNQKVYIPSIAQTIEKIIVFLVVLLLTPIVLKRSSLANTLLIVKFTLIIIYLIKILVLRFLIKREWKYITFKKEHSDIIIPNQGYTLLNATVGKMQTTIPAIVATFALGLTQVSIISIYSAIILGISGIINIFRSGVDAGFGELIANGEEKKLEAAFSEFQSIFYFIAVLINSLIASLLPTFMNLYIGVKEGIDYVIPSFALIYTAMTFITDMRIPHVILLNASGKYKERAKVNVFYLIIVFPFTLLLAFIGNIYKLGLQFIMISMMLFNVIRLVEHVFLSKKVLGLHSGSKNNKIITFSIIFFILLTLPNYIFLNAIMIHINNYFKWILYSGVLGGAYFILLILFYYFIDSKNFKNLLKRIKSVALKKVNK